MAFGWNAPYCPRHGVEVFHVDVLQIDVRQTSKERLVHGSHQDMHPRLRMGRPHLAHNVVSQGA